MVRTWAKGCGNMNRKNNIAGEESTGLDWWPYMGNRKAGEVKFELGDEKNNATMKEIAKSDYRGLRK